MLVSISCWYMCAGDFVKQCVPEVMGTYPLILHIPLEKITFTLEQKKLFYRKNCLVVKKNCLLVKKKLPFNFEKTHIPLEKSLLGFMPKLLLPFEKNCLCL